MKGSLSELRVRDVRSKIKGSRDHPEKVANELRGGLLLHGRGLGGNKRSNDVKG